MLKEIKNMISEIKKNTKSVDDFVEKTHSLKCFGRDENNKKALKESVDVLVQVYKSPGSNMISSNVTCPYNTGGHGQRCKASHPTVDKIYGKEVYCPYAFDINAEF